jgi:hypothetical protein
VIEWHEGCEAIEQPADCSVNGQRLLQHQVFAPFRAEACCAFTVSPRVSHSHRLALALRVALQWSVSLCLIFRRSFMRLFQEMFCELF